MKLPQKLILIVVAFLALCVVGCKDESVTIIPVDHIKVVTGADQSTLPNEQYPIPLRIELEGPLKAGMLGGGGSRPLVPNHIVHFVPLDNSDIMVIPATVKTDEGGSAQVTVKAGRSVGDHYIKIIPEGHEDKSVTVRFSSGMKIYGGNQEQKTGTVTQSPITVKMIDSEGKPLVGVPVYFSLSNVPKKSKGTAKLIDTQSVTNADGEASTRVKIGKASGEYKVEIEVADPNTGVFLRSKSVRELGYNFMAIAIAVLGGLAIFVFGMKLMGDGLQLIAGENMKRILHFFSRNSIIGVAAGTMVTAVIQSSSATTVMVIGFINAGLLSLQQSIGIIFGSNIGTTITAQIISFNISGVALPAITIGFLLTLSKKQLIRGWGETTLGFGLLFFGMSMMSDELKMLGTFPSFYNAFQAFDCTPIAGGFMPLGSVCGAIVIGLFATVLIQSSSAAMGIVLALAAGGLINFYTAVPLLLGSNIGTTVTAFLAALTANRVSKQAAIAHSLFNVLGTIILLVTFYIPYGPSRIPVFLYFINYITPGNVFAAVPHGIERHIAMAHTFFNIFVTIILVPFIPAITKLCELILPVRNDKQLATTTLEPHLIATPSLALDRAIQNLHDMTQLAWTIVTQAYIDHFKEGKIDKDKEQELENLVKEIEETQSATTDYLVQISSGDLTAVQSNLISVLLCCTNDAERIATYSSEIILLTNHIARGSKKLSKDAIKDINSIWKILAQEAQILIDALQKGTSCSTSKLQKELIALKNRCESGHFDRLRKGKCHASMGVIYIEMLDNLEKLGILINNIAKKTPAIKGHHVNI